MKKKILDIILTLVYIFFSLIFAGSFYLTKFFPNTTFEQSFFSMLLDVGGTPYVILKRTFVYGIVYSSPLIILLFIPRLIKIIFKKEINKSLVLTLKGVMLVVIFVATFYNFGLFEYINNQKNTSTIYEERYVDPKDVKITMNNKKNLIYIYVESMESTYNDVIIDNKHVNLIPELEKIANDNINISSNSQLGGAYEVYGAAWTKASDVATSLGVNVKLNLESDYRKEYEDAYKGVKSLGEILQDFGYKNYLLLGSDADFAGTRNFYNKHGNYNILGPKEALDLGLVKKSERKNWGIEDEKLIEIAKKELLAVAKKNEPFNYTIFTIDTHFPGYVNPKCETTHNEVFADSVSCESKMLYEFIEWIKGQDFYEDSVVVITGDHLSMEVKPYIDNEDRSKRKIYNAFLNVKPTSTYYKNREFSNLDLFPTVLAAMGAEIEGNRLGLGVNLFSEEKTIIEEYGYDTIDEDLSYKSNYYNDFILK